MRVLLFVLTLVATTWAAASQPVSGTLIKSGFDMYIQSDDACGKYRIDPKSEDTLNTMLKLAPGDSVTATGVFDKQNCIAAIESIDYVGLKRLLGNWMSKDGLIYVHDFNTMSFYPLGNTAIADQTTQPGKTSRAPGFQIVKPVLYKYSLTPSDGKEWVLFLSDAESTTFATIQFNKDIAVMKIYDSENGNVTKVMVLTRRGVLK